MNSFVPKERTPKDLPPITHGVCQRMFAIGLPYEPKDQETLLKEIEERNKKMIQDRISSDDPKKQVELMIEEKSPERVQEFSACDEDIDLYSLPSDKTRDNQKTSD